MSEIFRILGTTPEVELTNREYQILERLYGAQRDGSIRRVEDQLTEDDALLATGFSYGRDSVTMRRNLQFAQGQVRGLIDKGILVEIPGGGFYRLSDRGLGVLQVYRSLREKFVTMPMIRIASELRTELTVTKGEFSAGRSYVREILERASSSIDLLDPYLRARTVSQLGGLDEGLRVRVILTSKSGWSSVARQDTIDHLQLLVLEGRAVTARVHPSAHSRWIIVDGREVWESSYTFGDLGRETARLSQHQDPRMAIAEFERYWTEAEPVRLELPSRRSP